MAGAEEKNPLKGSSVSDMYQKIEEDSTTLGRLASKLPGFQGYLERSRRREADQILRDTIAARLEQTRLQLSNVHQELSRDMVRAIDYAEPLGRADSRLMGLIGKIKDAPQGYSGFFDAIKVDEAALQRLYQFDENMLAYSEAIAADVAVLQETLANDSDLDNKIRNLDVSIQDAINAFSLRQEILTGAS